VTITGILPVLERDLDRFAILQASLLANRGDLAGCVVITDGNRETVAAQINDPFYTVFDETAILGRRAPKWVFNWQKKRPSHAGWYVQQLLKLAAVAASTSDFCLTLDGDLIALKPFDEGAVAPGGIAVAQVHPDDAHPLWYVGSSRVLGMGRSGHAYAVTPNLYSPEACRMMIEHLEHRALRVERNWIDMLLHRVPWTEQALYFTFLEGAGIFDKFHSRTHDGVWYGASSVWSREDFAAWEMPTDADSFFAVIQSRSGITAKEIRDRLGT
jgi:hypothetical protein